ncbi:hypothetical protein cypCar_00048405, partial [Cyprinus carpio]
MEVPSNVIGHGMQIGMAMLLISKPHGNPGGSNISCSLDSSRNITCLDHDYCPYAEEVERINLTIYFRSSFVVESYNTKFYIMDIVRPDMVPISRINKTSVEVKYPHSWSTPSSYFPLMFQVKEIRCRKHDNCDCSKPYSQEVTPHTTGQKNNATIETKRECILKGLCIYLNEDPQDLVREYL